jgi:BirA family biotin operon repressor/biotin-[acetyl-CoA-carboxylase] ligase
MGNSFFIEETQSTNLLLWKMNREKALPEGFVVFTDFQTAGKGQIGNSWESDAGKNLLFSMVLYPKQVPVDQLFLISQLVSIGIKRTLDEYVGEITVKWPNDIYWNDKKIAGILIENSLQGNRIKAVVIGVGLNVNQKVFVSDATNPVSLSQITGKNFNRKLILNKINQDILNLYAELDAEKIRSEYAESLYRKVGFHSFSADGKSFQAKIIFVHPDGQLELEIENGERKGFYFKEVKFLI